MASRAGVVMGLDSRDSWIHTLDWAVDQAVFEHRPPTPTCSSSVREHRGAWVRLFGSTSTAIARRPPSTAGR